MVFDHIPEKEKYIFQGRQPGSIDDEARRGNKVKKSKHNFTHRMLDQEPLNSTGDQVRITDSKNFPISKTIIQPDAIREMHWHPNADEWSFFISSRARVTIFAAQGDVGIVRRNMWHFIENIRNEPVEMLEISRSDEFQNISLFKWMGETPQKQSLIPSLPMIRKAAGSFWTGSGTLTTMLSLSPTLSGREVGRSCSYHGRENGIDILDGIQDYF